MSRSSEFWNRFAYQHATFRDDHNRLDHGTKRFMPNVQLNNPVLGGGGTAGFAKLLYGISLFANQASIVEAAKRDIARIYGISIGMALHGPNANKGVLMSYSVRYRRVKDEMGKKVGSYGHSVAFLGSGAKANDVYDRVMFGSRTPTLSSGNSTSRVPPNMDQVVCYMWIFRR